MAGFRVHDTQSYLQRMGKWMMRAIFRLENRGGRDELEKLYMKSYWVGIGLNVTGK
jgi:hypothetical protein